MSSFVQLLWRKPSPNLYFCLLFVPCWPLHSSLWSLDGLSSHASQTLQVSFWVHFSLCNPSSTILNNVKGYLLSCHYQKEFGIQIERWTLGWSYAFWLVFLKLLSSESSPSCGKGHQQSLVSCEVVGCSWNRVPQNYCIVYDDCRYPWQLGRKRSWREFFFKERVDGPRSEGL